MEDTFLGFDEKNWLNLKKDLKEIEEDALKESKVREKIQGIVL